MRREGGDGGWESAGRCSPGKVQIGRKDGQREDESLMEKRAGKPTEPRVGQ